MAIKKNKYKSNIPLTGKAFLAVEYSALISAGYSASDLISAGYSASDLISAGYSLSDLISAGYSASDLRSAGYSASDLISAGYSASDLRSAGYSASDLKELEEIIKKLPKLEKPYSYLWKELQEKKRIHKQSEWGPDAPCDNLCGTPMCTAGHLVNMSGKYGYKLKDMTSWKIAAVIIHNRIHPDIPNQNFNNIPQDLALEYIKQMAEFEENSEVKK